jgi:hypothetical protein
VRSGSRRPVLDAISDAGAHAVAADVLFAGFGGFWLSLFAIA